MRVRLGTQLVLWKHALSRRIDRNHPLSGFEGLAFLLITAIAFTAAAVLDVVVGVARLVRRPADRKPAASGSGHG